LVAVVKRQAGEREREEKGSKGKKGDRFREKKAERGRRMRDGAPKSPKSTGCASHPTASSTPRGLEKKQGLWKRGRGRSQDGKQGKESVWKGEKKHKVGGRKKKENLRTPRRTKSDFFKNRTMPLTGRC